MRVGVVGLGFGAAVHVPALRLVEGVDVVAIAGANQHRAVATAERLDIPHGCGSLSELLDVGVDAVTVAVPPDRQADIAGSVLAAGLPLLVEKPIAGSVAAAEELVRVASQLPTSVDFEFAELATFRGLRAAITAGELGEVRELRATWLTRSRAHEHGEWSWKRDRQRGGGVLTLLGSHMLYLVEWLIGPLVSLSVGTPGRLVAPPGIEPERVALSALTVDGRTGTGVSVSIAMDNASDHQSHEWHVAFDEVTLIASNLGLDAVAGFRLIEEGADGARETLIEEPARDDVDGRIAPVASLCSRFIRSIEERTAFEPGIREGLRVQRLLADVEEAVGHHAPYGVAAS